jgi:hypothetical protein
VLMIVSTSPLMNSSDEGGRLPSTAMTGIAGRKLISQFVPSGHWMRNFISVIFVIACGYS